MNRAPDTIRHPDRVVYDPRDLWPTPNKIMLRRRRSWSQRADDARWAVEDTLDALADICRRRARALDRAVFGIAILTVTLIVARAAVALIERHV